MFRETLMKHWHEDWKRNNCCFPCNFPYFFNDIVSCLWIRKNLIPNGRYLINVQWSSIESLKIFSSDWMVIAFSEKSTDPSMSVWRNSVKFYRNNSSTLSDIILERSFGNKQQQYFDHEKESRYWIMRIGMLMPIVYTSSEPSPLKVFMSKPKPTYPSIESWFILTFEPITLFVKLTTKDSVF